MKMLWKGYISFGLVNIPIRLHSADKGAELRFRLLDSRDKSRIRYEKINEHTGKEVPWNKIVKAYQLSKDNFIVIKNEKISPQNFPNITIENFINAREINPIYLDKPYYLIPEGSNIKTFVLFRESLIRSKKVGFAKITIRAREHISIIYPYQNILVLQILRFPQDIIKLSEFEFSRENLDAKLSAKEIELAEKLIDHMTSDWHPEKYHDQSREKMMTLIQHLAKKEKFKELPFENIKLVKSPRNLISLLERSIPNKKTNSKKKTSSKKKIKHK